MIGPAAPAPAYPSVAQALAAAAASRAGVSFVALDEGVETLPWREVHARARRVAAALADLGVARGDRVALVLGTGRDFVDAFFGATLAGAVPVPLAPPQRLGRLDEYYAGVARMLDAVGARLVLTDARVKRLLGVAIAAARPPLGCVTVEPLLAHADGLELDSAPEALGLIQFSSGSTVDPKPVALTQRNLMMQLAVLEQMVPSNDRERQVCAIWLPLHHDMGLIGALLGFVNRRDPLYLIAPEAFLARPALWLRTIARHRVTVSVAPSFSYALCLRRIPDGELDGLDLGSWRYALNGAEPVSVAVLEEFTARFARCGFGRDVLMPVYGLAEATLAVTFAPTRTRFRALGVDAARLASERIAVDGSRAIASVGRPVPGVALEVRDDGGVPLGERRVGRIWVRGPTVMAGYFGNEAASARVLVDGWLDTGDLGFAAGGELYVCGRAKDVVIIRGANHAPQEFEECLDDVPGVRVGCAVALGFIPSRESGGSDEEALLILAERASDAAVGGGPRGAAERDAALVEAIRAAILRRTGIRAHTVRLLAPGTLPRTTSGKLRRAEALRRFLADALTPPRPVSALRLAGAVARSTLAFAKLRVSGAD